FTQMIIPIDLVIENFIERMNFIYSNTELKTEHRGYLFSCDRLRIHLFTFQQICRSIILFLKTLNKLINEENMNQLLLNLNIVLFLYNKSCVYLELIYKYIKIYLNEERKIS